MTSGSRPGFPAPRWRLLLILALTGGLAGCSALPWFKEQDPHPPTPLAPIVAETTLTTVWSKRVTAGTGPRRLSLVPASAGGRLYVADARGQVAAVDQATGQTIWQRDLDLPFSGGPAVRGELLAIGTSRGELVLLSAADGQERWRVPVGGEVLSVPYLTESGQAIVHTLDDSILALETASGKLLWRVNYPAPALTLRGSASPVGVTDGLLAGLAGGRLVKLDPRDGAPLWDVLITHPRGRSELARIADLDADPVVVGGLIFAAVYNGDLAALDLTTGTIQWRRELSAYAGLAAGPDRLFVTAADDRVVGADPIDGAGRWQQEALRYRQLSAPALIGNRIAVGDLEGYLHLLDQADGRLVGRLRLTSGGALRARPLVEGERLYVLADDGTLAALTLGPAAHKN